MNPRRGIRSIRAGFALLLVPATMSIVSARVALAENIDPAQDGSKYAWAENLGWLNAQPGGPGGPGIQVSDTALTGWIWSENAGWISLSCANLSCGGGAYGVTSDGCGRLSGFAWAENVGWMNFAPTTCNGDPTCGVRIDPATGRFAGRAWSENAGWITFASTGPNPYQVVTSWRGVPAGVAALSVSKQAGSNVQLAWTALPGAVSYDVVQGGLSALRGSHGDFQSATQACIVRHAAATSFETGGSPALGDGYWFLVRGVKCGPGSYNDGTQVAPRDAGILASGNDCAP